MFDQQAEPGFLDTETAFAGMGVDLVAQAAALAAGQHQIEHHAEIRAEKELHAVGDDRVDRIGSGNGAGRAILAAGQARAQQVFGSCDDEAVLARIVMLQGAARNLGGARHFVGAQAGIPFLAQHRGGGFDQPLLHLVRALRLRAAPWRLAGDGRLRGCTAAAGPCDHRFSSGHGAPRRRA